MDLNSTEVFKLVGIRPVAGAEPKVVNKWYKGKPILAILLLSVIVICCLFCELIMTKDPAYMDLTQYLHKPDGQFLFGTDSMGRDIFSMIWFGGRSSLIIGFLATAISTAIAILFGAVSGMAPAWLDNLLMRLTEILLSVPSLLFVIFIQAIIGEANIFTLSFVIGVTSWQSIAKIVRSEVRRMRQSEYVLASKCMGGGFFHILRWHLAPNFFSAIMFMVVMNIRGAIVTESTLSFMGMGLPLETISWGSMLSLSDAALTSGAWWIIIIPGAFLVTTIVCITEIGNHLRKTINRGDSNL